MSEPLSLQMSRGRALTVAACFLAAGLLLFAAGTVSGLLMASASFKAQSAKVQMPAPAHLAAPAIKPIVAAPGILTNSTPGPPDTTSAESLPAHVPTLAAMAPAPPPASRPQAPAAAPAGQQASAVSSSATPSPSSGAAASAPTASAQAASSGAPQSGGESSYALPLAIKVCSFTGRASAENLIAALAAKGYRASIGHSTDAHGRTWYVVELGPYTEWNQASTVAARIAVAENVKPVIGPVR